MPHLPHSHSKKKTAYVWVSSREYTGTFNHTYEQKNLQMYPVDRGQQERVKMKLLGDVRVAVDVLKQKQVVTQCANKQTEKRRTMHSENQMKQRKKVQSYG